MVFPTAPTRLGGIAAAVALAAVLAAWGLSHGAIFSPGELHAGDSTPRVLGSVRSHAELAGRCGACHAPPWGAGGMSARCVACHRDVGREVAARDTASVHGVLTAGDRCQGCHTDHAGPTGAITRVKGFDAAHGRLGFALDAHRRTSDGAPFTCAGCHEGGGFAFDDARCESCHREYQDRFVTTHVSAWGSDCRACHDGTDRFSRGAFAHDTTAFRLDGAHVRAGCDGCHTATRTLADFRKAPVTCVGCHEKDDTHRGEMGTDCGSCHGTARWDDATFAHEAFPLDHGGEGRIACRTCHEDAANYKSYTCYNCHEHSRERVAAEHRGEVRRTNLDDCLACHRGGRGEGGGDSERRGRRH
jgi:hypothetical protein